MFPAFQEFKVPLQTQNKHNTEQAELGLNSTPATHYLCGLK